MLFVPYRRATLLVPSGPAHDPDQKHLFILLNDPARVLGYGDKHSLLVGVTTIHAAIPHDPACELYPGDHPFIRRNTLTLLPYASWRFIRRSISKQRYEPRLLEMTVMRQRLRNSSCLHYLE